MGFSELPPPASPSTVSCGPKEVRVKVRQFLHKRRGLAITLGKAHLAALGLTDPDGMVKVNIGIGEHQGTIQVEKATEPGWKLLKPVLSGARSFNLTGVLPGIELPDPTIALTARHEFITPANAGIAPYLRIYLPEPCWLVADDD
jgi:hypothetical protein